MTISQVIWRYINRHPTRISFLTIASIVLYLNLAHLDYVFRYDALEYWTHSNDFIKNGIFSFLNYDFPLRGYLFPFILFATSGLSRLTGISSYVGYEIVVSLFYSIAITIVIPEIIQLLVGRKTQLLQILIFSFFAIYFWRGSFFYPLTDLPAFLFLIIGTYCVLKFSRRWWSGILAGLLWGGSILLRPSYQISLIPLLLWGLYFYYSQILNQLWPTMFRFVTMMTGIILILGPQTAINWHNYKIFSPFVQTQIFFKGADLFSIQLGWGLELQKYETNIGTNYPLPAVRFLDPHGESILIRSGHKSASYRDSGQIGPDSSLTLAQYIRLAIRYPLDFIALYGRHFFNGLDIIYDSVYVQNIFTGAVLVRFINYSIWFVVLIYLVYKISFRRAGMLNTQFILPLAFALPALLSIPTAMEVRFMLPLHFMAYALVAFWVLPEFLAIDPIRRKETILKYLFWYGCFVVLCFMLSTNTYMEIEYGAYVLSAK